MRYSPLVLALCFLAGCGSSNDGDGQQDETDHGQVASDNDVAADDDIANDDDPLVGDGDSDDGAVNPCATDNGGCDEHATCANAAGVAQCTCNELYSGDGTTCTIAVDVWSTWSGKPSFGGDATIPEGTVLYIDESIDVGALLIEGELHAFPDVSFTVHADHIKLGANALLEIGKPERPYTGQAYFTFSGVDDALPPAARGIDATSGRLVMVGNPPPTPWTHLTANAEAGASVLEVEDALGWHVGDTIAVTPTDYYVYDVYVSPLFRPPGGVVEATHLTTLSAAAEHSIEMVAPLIAPRWGTTQTIDGIELDERAEVANLSRNIVLQGIEDSDYTDDGHGVVIYGSNIYVDGIAVRLAGWGMNRPFDLVDNNTILNSSITQSRSGCIGIRHGSHNLIRNNVCVGVEGHGIGTPPSAIPDVTTDIVVEHNLVAGVRYSSATVNLADDERNTVNGGASAYLIGTPHSTYRDNVAADAQGNGFWLVFAKVDGAAQQPFQTPLDGMSGNVAHSNGYFGIQVAYGFQNNAVDNTGAVIYDPKDELGDSVRVPISGSTVYRNAHGGLACDSDEIVWTGSVVADNNRFAFGSALGYFFAPHTIVDSGVISQSSNASSERPVPQSADGIVATLFNAPTVTNTIWSGFTTDTTSNVGAVLAPFNASNIRRELSPWLRGWGADNVLASSHLSWFHDAVPTQDPLGVLTGAPGSFIPSDYIAMLADPGCAAYAVAGNERGKTCLSELIEVTDVTLSGVPSYAGFTLDRFSSFPSGASTATKTYDPATPTRSATAAVTSGAPFLMQFPGHATPVGRVVTITYGDGYTVPGAVIALPIKTTTTVNVHRTWRYYPPFGDLELVATASYADFLSSNGTKYFKDTTRVYVLVGPGVHDTPLTPADPAFANWLKLPIDLKVTLSGTPE